MEQLDILNARLKDTYGYDFNKPKFRLVWSTTELEKRLGTFNDYSGGIFLRQREEVREVPKYPSYSNRWILEVSAFSPGDTVNHNGYEPLYVFDNDGRALEPVWRAIAYIVSMALNPIHRSPSDLDAIDDAKMEEERKYYLDFLADQETIGVASGNSIIVP